MPRSDSFGVTQFDGGGGVPRGGGSFAPSGHSGAGGDHRSGDGFAALEEAVHRTDKFFEDLPNNVEQHAEQIMGTAIGMALSYKAAEASYNKYREWRDSIDETKGVLENVGRQFELELQRQVQPWQDLAQRVNNDFQDDYETVQRFMGRAGQEVEREVERGFEDMLDSGEGFTEDAIWTARQTLVSMRNMPVPELEGEAEALSAVTGTTVEATPEGIAAVMLANPELFAVIEL